MRRVTDNKALLGALLIAGLLVLVVAINTGFVSSQLSERGRTARAQFGNTGQLKKGDSVRVDGVVAGRVKDVSLAADGRSAIVELTMFDRAGTIRRDAKARIRWRTALGGSFAVDVDPGSPAQPALGERTIPLSRTQNQVEIEDAIAFNRGAAKDGLRSTLKELPAALHDPAALTRALDDLDRASPALADTLGAFRGSRELGLRRVVQATARTLRALDTPTDQVRRVVEGGAATVRVTAQRSGELGRTFEVAGAIQPRVRSTLAALQRTLAKADPLVTRLSVGAPDVAPTLAHLRPTVRAADRLLVSARPVAYNLQRSAHSLAATSRAGAPLVARLRPSVRRLAETLLPGLAERDPVTKLRTYEIVGPTIASLNGAAATFDSEGHLFRFPALGGERSVANLTPCNVLLTDPEESAVLKCESILDSLKRVLTFRPPGRRR
jgi:phospholipid/cholesterol/gamma-HCH transport system substrate-binding protein